MLRRVVLALVAVSASGLLKTRRVTKAPATKAPVSARAAVEQETAPPLDSLRAGAMGLGLACATFAEPAMAKGGEYGLAEGRIISLAHPVMMGVCFLSTLYAGYTGYQWRRLREVGVEVQAAKAVVSEKQAAVDALGEDADSTAAVAALGAAKSEFDTLAAFRKNLAAGDFRDSHYTMGTVLLALGIPFALEGPVNTYMRAGKLFPGPHLYAGVGVVALWAFAAALVPQMQKGKDWARYGHIGANGISTLLFAYYQIPTGLEIANKVIQNTKFP